MQERTREGEGEGRGGAGRGVGGAASRIFLVLASDSRTDSSRKRPGGVGGGDGARGDVRGGEARAGGDGGSVSGTRVEVGRSELPGAVSPPAASARLCQRASERVPANPRWRSPPSRSLRGLTARSPARSVTPSAASRRFPLGLFPPASSCSPSKLQR